MAEQQTDRKLQVLRYITGFFCFFACLNRRNCCTVDQSTVQYRAIQYSSIKLKNFAKKFAKMCNNCERIWKRHTIELDEKIRDFRQKFADFKSHRLNTLQTLKEICTELTGHRRNVNIATVAGCSTSIVGGIMAGVGLIATPFTLGTNCFT